MKNIFVNMALIAGLLLLTVGCGSDSYSWEQLFNGKDLSGWEYFAGPVEEGGEPLGLNNDPLNLFSVVEMDGKNVIRISGEINASLATLKEFGNYHLVVEFKWGDKVFDKRNSGLLYHSYGPYGEGLGVWMSSHEMQMWSGNIGDSYRMGNSYCAIPAIETGGGKYTYSKGGDLHESIPGTDTRIIAKDRDYEKPVGEWNTIELYCFDRTSAHIVNGHVNMINYNSGKLSNGNIEPLTKGKIQFQSEGGELFIRSIKLRPISEIPKDILM